MVVVAVEAVEEVDTYCLLCYVSLSSYQKIYICTVQSAKTSATNKIFVQKSVPHIYVTACS